MNVKDKVIVVTGSSRGIGLAIADTLAEHGAHVVVASTNQEKASQVAESLSKKHGVEAKGFAVDVSSQDSTNALIQQTMDAFGRVDVLVNNAGITRDNLLLRLKADDWQSVLDTNLNSVFYLSKAVLKPMLKQKRWSYN